MTPDQAGTGKDVVVRRMILRVGEATPWHVDPCRRYSVVLGGDRLIIEFRQGEELEEIVVHRGMAGWDDPDPRVHRAINSGTQPYEELVTFLLVTPGTEPQPTLPG